MAVPAEPRNLGAMRSGGVVLVCAVLAALVPGMSLARGGFAGAGDDGVVIGETAVGAAVAVDPALVVALLRESMGGATGSDGLLLAGRAGGEMVECHPASVLVVSEAIREIGRRAGFRGADAAGVLEAVGDLDPWLVALVAAGGSFERDRAAYLKVVGEVESGDLDGERLAGGWIVRSRLLLAMDRQDDALVAARSIAFARDGVVDAWALDARLRLLERLGRDAELVGLALGALPAERPSAGDATVAERLSLAGEAALRVNDRLLGLMLLSAARSADPGRLSRHERVVRLLLEEPGAMDSISLRSPLGRGLALLRRDHPDAALLELVLVGEAVRREQPALVVRTLERLAERFPDDAMIREELVARWIDVGEVEKARLMIERRLAVTPEAAQAGDLVLYGRILAAEGMPDVAIRRLGTWIDERGDDARVLGELERLFLVGVFSERDARRMHRRRLGIEPRTIGHEIERAMLEVTARESVVAVGAMRSAFERTAAVELRSPAGAWLSIPARLEPVLTTEQRFGAIGAITAMMGHGDQSVVSSEVVAMFEAGERALSPLPEDLAMHWVSMVLVSGSGLDAALAAADRVSSGSLALRRVVFRELVIELGQGGRLNNEFMIGLRGDPRSAVRAARHGALGAGGVDADLFGVWMLAGVVGAAGDASDERRREVAASVAECVRLADGAGVLGAALVSVTEGSRSSNPADLCQQLVGIMDANDHWDAAVMLYERALGFDPMHASINNSYGYRLLERDEEIERAEAMIERAVRADPMEPAYLDSLGWARYKRGILRDAPRVGPLGEGKEGAITLLERALERIGPLGGLDGDEVEAGLAMLVKPTILDHAGDAYWAAGDERLALERWGAAVRRAEEAAALRKDVLDLVSGGGSAMRELERVKASAAEKLRAAAAGEEVRISRIHGDVPAGGASNGGAGGPGT